MAYFDWSIGSTSTFGEYNAHLSQALVPEQVDVNAPETSTNAWSILPEQQDHYDVDRWPTNFEPGVNFGEYDYSILKGRGLTNLSPEPTTSGTSYDQWLFPEFCWPATERWAQPDHRTALNYDNPSASRATLEVPELMPAPSNSEPFLLLRGFEEPGVHRPRMDWGGIESGQVSDPFYEVGGQT